MPFPAILYCLVSDTVRLEERNKLSILGFFGHAPVGITVTTFGGVITLAFTLIADQGEDGTYTLGFEISDGKKSIVPRSVNQGSVIASKNRQTNLVFEVTAPYPGPGQYFIRLYIDEAKTPHFEASFELALG